MLSPTLVTADIAAVRAFYEHHFDAAPVFDCGWYVVLRLPLGAELCLKAPQGDETPLAAAGLTLNLKVADVDEWHRRLAADAGLAVGMPLEDHPWGDRGFSVTDPAGVTLYLYTPIAPSADFLPFFKEPATA